MSKVWHGAAGFLKRHKKMCIALLALLAAGAVAWLVLFRTQTGVQAMAALPETTVLAKMDLEQSVTATGTLQSANTKEVTTDLSYEVKQVLVSEGDTVTQGQTLCVLDSTELDKKIAELQQNISENAAADALKLEQAGRKLQEAIDDRDYNSAANAASVQTALDALNAANSGVETARAAKTEAKELHMSLKEQLGGLEKTDPDYAAVKERYTAAKADHEAKDKTLSEKTEQAAQAQDAYDKAVSAQESAYRNDTKNVDNAQDSLNSQKLQDSTKADKTQLEEYQEEREQLTVTAPISGTVTSVSAEAGQSAGGSGGTGDTGSTGGTASTGALFTIQDAKDLEIPASVPEYDIPQVAVGQTVTITSDALDDTAWTGTVTSISPTASDSNFTVLVSVGPDVDGLAIGMSAKMQIITQSAKDVYAVPFDAVTTNAAGETVVYALETGGGQGMPPAFSGSMPEAADVSGERPGIPQGTQAAGGDTQSGEARTEIPVTTGLETDYYIEISGDGLRDGLAILNDPSGNTVTASDTGGASSGNTGLPGLGGGMGMQGGGAPPDGGGAPPAGR